MKKTAISLLLFVSALTALGQENDPDCLQRMKKGVFVAQESEMMEVVRTSLEHVEVFGEGNAKLFHQIEWENDSTFVLTMKRAVNAVGCLEQGEQVRTNITGCTGNRYMTFSKSDACGSSNEVFEKIE